MSPARGKRTAAPSALLAGKVALVTGGGRGIGAEAAALLAGAGAAVSLAARSAGEIEGVARRIRRAGGTALAVPTDVTDLDRVERLVERTVDELGRIDFLVHCAAIVEPDGTPAWETDPREWSRVVTTNLVGVFHLCHAVVPRMLEQEEGRLLILSSVLGERPAPFASAYRASKAGITHFTRVLANELRGTGVTANAVYPGLVDTELLRHYRSGGEGGDGEDGRMRGRSPAEPARLLLWLCGPGTARMTGQVVDIDDPRVELWVDRFVRRNGLTAARRPRWPALDGG